MEQLFSGIEGTDRQSLMECLQAVPRRYKKGEMVLSAGGATAVGLITSGAVQVIAEDPMGNRAIIGRMEAGDLFGEAFACAGAARMPFSVEAAADSDVLLIDVKRILTTCPTACRFSFAADRKPDGHPCAQESSSWARRFANLSRRSTRDKLLSYLSEQAREAGSRSFTIPFNGRSWPIPCASTAAP